MGLRSGIPEPHTVASGLERIRYLSVTDGTQKLAEDLLGFNMFLVGVLG
jgi:hypothetical protein